MAAIDSYFHGINSPPACMKTMSNEEGKFIFKIPDTNNQWLPRTWVSG
jgi:hypothetical protein